LDAVRCMVSAGWSATVFGGSATGQRTMQGTRISPSRVLPFKPGNGFSTAEALGPNQILSPSLTLRGEGRRHRSGVDETKRIGWHETAGKPINEHRQQQILRRGRISAI